MYDLEMLEQMGFVQGIENYSRHLSARKPGDPPPTLIDYFPKDFLLVIDESHQTVSQIGAMYRGDRSRKETLVDFGFRLAERARQSSAEVRRVRAAHGANGVRLRNARRIRTVALGRSHRRTAHSPHRADGSGDRGPSRRRPGRRPPQDDPRTRRARRTRSRDDAHQADGRRSDGVLRRARSAGPVPALGRRDARPYRAPARAPRRAITTSSSASTCSARVSTCRR